MFRSLMRHVATATAMILSFAAMLGHASAAADEIETQPTRQAAVPEEKASYPEGLIKEGPLPEGFPPPGPVGRILEKTYPLCRTFSAEGNSAFMRCFAYLSKQQHEMTAPVIMDYRKTDPSADANSGDVARMHFVLQDMSLDEPKQDGPVLVADLAETRVLSIAVQGEMTDRALQDARKALEAEAASRANISVAGPMRVLGYNSPMVPRQKRFWEVQLPIKEEPSPEP